MILKDFLHRLARMAHKKQRDVIYLPNDNLSPVEAIQTYNVPFAVTVPLTALRGFAISPSSLAAQNNPFLQTARYIVNGGRSYTQSPLAEYYRTYHPSTAAEVLGLDANSKLASYKPLAAVLPWHHLSPEDHESFMRNGINSYWRTKKVLLTADDGVTEYGPAIPLKGEEEIKRTLEVYKSITEKGYHTKHGYILTTLLVGEDKNAWALHVRDGIHRAAVLLAIGQTHAPICVKGGDMAAVVKRIEVNNWHHVQSGLFTQKEALQIFDRLLYGA